MTSRKPPSQRNPEYAVARMARALQSMSPGSMGGRVANASPVSSTSTTALAAAATGSSDVALQEFLPAFSNTGELFVQTGTHRLYIEHACTIVSVRASVGYPSTGASVIVDVNKNGTTIFTTQANRPTITAGTYTALAAAVNVTTLDPGDYLTVDIDQIGTTVPGADLTVTLEVAFEGVGGEMSSTGWTPELIITGYAHVGTNIAPPGLRVPFACTMSAAYLRVGTAPSGASLVVAVKDGATTLATLTITSGGTSTSATGLALVLAAGDIITFDVTGIGSTVAGADLAVQLIAT